MNNHYFLTMSRVPKNIIISESQYKYLFKEDMFYLCEDILSLSDVYKKWYTDKIDEDTFKQIVSADPTTNLEKQKMGKYSKWLLSLYLRGNLKTEDLYKATEYLSAFSKFINKIQVKDINQYKSLPQLYNTVKPFIEDPNQATSHSDEIRKQKLEGAEKVYEDEKWLVIVPKTKEAAIQYGKHTQWCTAATTSNNMFDYYKNQGATLYINIDKQDNRKYQFCFETQEFMDESDSPVDIPDIDLSDGLFNYYYQAQPNYRLYLKYWYVNELGSGDYDMAIVQNDNRKFELRTFQDKPVLNDEYDFIDECYRSFPLFLRKDGKYTILNKELKSITGNQTVEQINPIDKISGFKITVQGKSNVVIRDKDNLLLPKWFDIIEYKHYGMNWFSCGENGKYYLYSYITSGDSVDLVNKQSADAIDMSKDNGIFARFGNEWYRLNIYEQEFEQM